MNKLAILLFGIWMLAPASAQAGLISRACLQADRNSATPQLCQCIQKVANVNLNRTERKRASKFFRNPQMAQETRQSSRRSDEIFWQRYKAFGAQAQKSCG